MMPQTDVLDKMLTRLKLTAIRYQLESLLDEAGRRQMSLRELLGFLEMGTLKRPTDTNRTGTCEGSSRSCLRLVRRQKSWSCHPSAPLDPDCPQAGFSGGLGGATKEPCSTCVRGHTAGGHGPAPRLLTFDLEGVL